MRNGLNRVVFIEKCMVIRRKSFFVYVLRYFGDECIFEFFIMIWFVR